MCECLVTCSQVIHIQRPSKYYILHVVCVVMHPLFLNLGEKIVFGWNGFTVLSFDYNIIILHL